MKDGIGHLELAGPVDGPHTVDVVLVAATCLQRCVAEQSKGKAKVKSSIGQEALKAVMVRALNMVFIWQTTI